MLDHAADTALFVADTLAPVDPIAQLLAAVRQPERFLVVRTARGYEGSFVGEYTAWNTSRAALAELAEAARGLGYDVCPTHGGAYLAIEPRRRVEDLADQMETAREVLDEVIAEEMAAKRTVAA